jgi:predicted AlkP superfamily pyrophosphatase or phosphodiesterase
MYASEEKAWAEFSEDPQRTEQIIRVLRLPDAERPRLILGYFRGPDEKAHFTGMESAETHQAVMQSDTSVGVILDAINDLPFRDQVTLIVTTDHGMVPISAIVNIAKILHNHKIDARAVSSGTTSFLYFSDRSQIDRAVQELSGYKQFDVVRKEEQPPDWHLGTGPRVGDLVVSAHPPYFIEDIGRWPSWARWLGRWGPEFMRVRFTRALAEFLEHIR